MQAPPEPSTSKSVPIPLVRAVPKITVVKKETGDQQPPKVQPLVVEVPHSAAEPYMTLEENDELAVAAIYNLLTTPDHRLISANVPPFFPRGGDVYVWEMGGDEELWAKSLRIDGYPWRAEGSKRLGKTNIVKHYRRIRMADGNAHSGFRRFEYVLLTDMRYVIFHYSGDHTLHKHRPHGNSVVKRSVTYRQPLIFKRARMDEENRHRHFELQRYADGSIGKYYTTGGSVAKHSAGAIPSSSTVPDPITNASVPGGDRQDVDDTDLPTTSSSSGAGVVHRVIERTEPAAGVELQCRPSTTTAGNKPLPKRRLDVPEPAAITSSLHDRLIMKQLRVAELQEEYLQLKIMHKRMEMSRQNQQQDRYSERQHDYFVPDEEYQEQEDDSEEVPDPTSHAVRLVDHPDGRIQQQHKLPYPVVEVRKLPVSHTASINVETSGHPQPGASSSHSNRLIEQPSPASQYYYMTEQAPSEIMEN